MLIVRKISVFLPLCHFSLPIWAGTGRPRDGFLSFILLFAFLVLILGMLQLAHFLKRKIREFFEDVY